MKLQLKSSIWVNQGGLVRQEGKSPSTGQQGGRYWNGTLI